MKRLSLIVAAAAAAVSLAPASARPADAWSPEWIRQVVWSQYDAQLRLPQPGIPRGALRVHSLACQIVPNSDRAGCAGTIQFRAVERAWVAVSVVALDDQHVAWSAKVIRCAHLPSLRPMPCA